jgi:hypothetical protein
MTNGVGVVNHAVKGVPRPCIGGGVACAPLNQGGRTVVVALNMGFANGAM